MYISERSAKSVGLCILVFCVGQLGLAQRFNALNAPKVLGRDIFDLALDAAVCSADSIEDKCSHYHVERFLV